ncbi:MAG: HlyD family efflux transporter periplasmic adaptor subunit [Negativicutes bacterium]|nr:HlyD family efflux transporter periplasmic adaptor subunit [Negativicutes bacterium]
MSFFRKSSKEKTLQETTVPDEQSASRETEDSSDFSAAIKVKKEKKKWPGFLIAVLCIALAVVGIVYYQKNKQSADNKNSASYSYYTVTKQDLVSSLSSSGMLLPADSYKVTTLVSGEVLSSNINEGDIVKKDAVLYQVDSSAISNTIARAELTLSQSQKNYDRKLASLEDLNITASEGGTVIELLVKTGDNLKSGQKVATLRNSSVMQLTLPFNSVDSKSFYLGQPAQVTLDSSYETLNGTIRQISAVDQIMSGNMLVRQVTIDVVNPGALSPLQSATAMVGDVACNAKGNFAYASETTITTSVSGEAATLLVKEGDFVTAGQLLLTLTSTILQDDLENAANSLKDAALAVQNQYDNLNSYTIKSPIAGTIIQKTAKTGDKLSPNAALCTIFDLSYLTLTLNIDELDISRLAVGQTATITADAVEGKTYTGTVTKVSIAGTTANGVTTYPITIRIDHTEGLLPGMNVTAMITFEARKNVLVIPIAAIVRGNRVLLKSEAAVQTPDQTSDPTIPKGYHYVDVNIGINNTDTVEITAGLSEGDVIAVKNSSTAPPAAQNPFGLR